MLSAGVNFLRPERYRFIKSQSTFDEVTIDITAEYEAEFGALLAGAKIFTRVQLIDGAGFATPWLEAATIVA